MKAYIAQQIVISAALAMAFILFSQLPLSGTPVFYTLKWLEVQAYFCIYLILSFTLQQRLSLVPTNHIMLRKCGNDEPF
ncbi:hypothetical protein NDN16_18620 [Aureimonas altamirensis]|uniref:hypothetical protein n=1 Tax=Aureimonas altamirensis TaxID=370622 RepID=UPI002037580B|nr:hypothetical protein [Aureimonas altamirensis]MCM2505682.1 hypothetical protein [Aureimonas altamirensis]